MHSDRRWAVLSRKIIGRQDNPMLIRWRLLQTPWFGIYLHFIHREDLDSLPHDHPWTFWTLILRGSYRERLHTDLRTGQLDKWPGTVEQTRPRWSFRRFPQTWAHRIVKVNGKVTTLVVVGRKSRTWGFYDGHGSFIDWRDYQVDASRPPETTKPESMTWPRDWSSRDPLAIVASIREQGGEAQYDAGNYSGDEWAYGPRIVITGPDGDDRVMHPGDTVAMGGMFHPAPWKTLREFSVRPGSREVTE